MDFGAIGAAGLPKLRRTRAHGSYAKKLQQNRPIRTDHYPVHIHHNQYCQFDSEGGAMRLRGAVGLGSAGVFLVVCLSRATAGDGLLDLKWGKSSPPTLTQVARMIDHIQSDILDQGTVVVKQPDVWSQARMTKFRKRIRKTTMNGELGRFQDYISGSIARSDFASLQSQTLLGASLTPLAGNQQVQLATPGDVTNERAAAVALLNSSAQSGSTTSTLPALPTSPGSGTPVQAFQLLGAVAPVGSVIDSTTGAYKAGTSALPLSLEPNVHLDEKADYLGHLHRIRRINLGDDNADSAGYGLYLVRVPVSVEPGDCTKKGFGAVVNLTMRHNFSPRFLQSTYRNLVINDLVDLLGPVIHELIRSGTALEYHKSLEHYWAARAKLLPGKVPVLAGGEEDTAQNKAQVYAAMKLTNPNIITPDDAAQKLKIVNNIRPAGRTGTRTFSIAPSDVKRVFVTQNLLNLAYAIQQELDMNSEQPPTWKVRATDVRTSPFATELEAAYDVMEGRCK